MPPMHDQKKGAVKLVKKDKDPVSQSGNKASRSGPKAEFRTSFTTYYCLTKLRMTNSVRMLPTINCGLWETEGLWVLDQGSPPGSAL